VQNGTLAVTGDFNRNPDSVTSTFRSSFIRSGITKLGSGDFRASGDVFPIWGGNNIGAAFGGEFRYEAYDDFRPPYAGLNPAGSGLDPVSNDFLGFSPNSDTHGNRHVAGAYLETAVPLVGGKFTLPLVHSLELTASARYERYTDFGEHHETQVWRQLASTPMGDGSRVLQPRLSRSQSRPALHRHAHPHGHRQHRYLPQRRHRP
jgi:iron complex outermembrane receptor protein